MTSVSSENYIGKEIDMSNEAIHTINCNFYINLFNMLWQRVGPSENTWLTFNSVKVSALMLNFSKLMLIFLLHSVLHLSQ